MSYPNWWWWFSSHHNDHNQGRERGTVENKKHVDKKPSNNVNDGHQLVRRGGNCTHVRDSRGRDSNKGSSCIYCWRNLSEGAKNQHTRSCLHSKITDSSPKVTKGLRVQKYFLDPLLLKTKKILVGHSSFELTRLYNLVNCQLSTWVC